MAQRLVRGIEPREDFPAAPLFEELLRERHLLIADHTRRHLREEIDLPGGAIDRGNRERWEKTGRKTLWQRAQRDVARLISKYQPSRLNEDAKRELTRRMKAEAERYGMDGLPVV
jgi:trimethylamine:corrinoid methyltransferase-like protein